MSYVFFGVLGCNGKKPIDNELNPRKQAAAIAANFVHSQDAAALIGAVNRCFEDGITGFASVHDSYGSHAACMEALNKHLRTAFVEIYSGDVLADFRAACVAAMVAGGIDPAEAEARVPAEPKRGDLDIKEVRDSRYFFA